MRVYIFIIVLLLATASCQKKSDTVPDAAKVNITINTPQNGQTFYSGDTVYINASVNYDGQLHGCEVKIIDTVSGFILYDDAQHVHSDKFLIDDKWLNDLTAPVVLKVSVTAYIDHNGNDVKQERTIFITP